MQSITISFKVWATDDDLHLTVLFDDITLWDGTALLHPLKLSHEFPDSENVNHVVTIKLSGKLPEHTKIDQQGQVIQDRVIKISDVCLDDIPVDQVFTAISEYHHDRNGTAEPCVEKCYGEMGCNGQVDFRFRTPVYLWLLENM